MDDWYATWIEALTKDKVTLESLDRGSVTVSYGVAPLVTMDLEQVVPHM